MALQNISIMTDFYQLSMANALFQVGKSEQEAIFNLFFRKIPFRGGFAISAGLEAVVDFLEKFRYLPEDIDYLASLDNHLQQKIFPDNFLNYLANLKFNCSLRSFLEGSLVFANEPLMQLQGPLAQCILLETPLLNLTNFPTLIATKAARVRLAAESDKVLEFGLRRAQGVDGALTASRAAIIGGCNATSNVLAGKVYGLKVAGTHAHSFVMAFESEEAAFAAYAEIYPDDTVLLIDTYDTLDGLQKAINVARSLAKKGHKIVGIRLDSGDLLRLSRQCRAMLDDAGLTYVQIVASGDLCEFEIEKLKLKNAPIDIWGVGTNLVTANDQPALDGVYKLAAIKEKEAWVLKQKISNSAAKKSLPGKLQVYRERCAKSGKYVQDLIVDEFNDSPAPKHAEKLSQKLIKACLIDIFCAGKLVYSPPPLTSICERVQKEVELLPAEVKKITTNTFYPVITI